LIHEGEGAVVVVGAGALGASTAYHLARLGVAPVVLIERRAVASQSSRRAAGLTLQARATDLMTRIASRSVAAIERFEKDTGQPLAWTRSGSLRIARTAAHAAKIRDEIACGRRNGVEVDLIEPAAARRLAPYLEPRGIAAVAHCPGDIYLEPGQLPVAFARAAVRLGATLMEHTAVTEIVTRDGRVERVVTDRGEHRVRALVDAAGAWSRLVGEMAGLAVPTVPTRHQLVISHPIAGVSAEQPIVRILDANVYVRPADGGLLLGAYEPDPLQVDVRAVPAGYDIGDLPLDAQVLRERAGRVVEQLPVLSDPAFAARELRGGLPTVTADGRPLVGPAPGLRNFYLATGCNVGGLSTSPGFGELLAEWMVAGEPPMDCAPLDPARFAPGPVDEERLRGECRWQYANQYTAR
jgi:4-methylaminobutanoate oxidase (formaldehyde-forming)